MTAELRTRSSRMARRLQGTNNLWPDFVAMRSYSRPDGHVQVTQEEAIDGRGAREDRTDNTRRKAPPAGVHRSDDVMPRIPPEQR